MNISKDRDTEFLKILKIMKFIGENGIMINMKEKEFRLIITIKNNWIINLIIGILLKLMDIGGNMKANLVTG
jgi:hypothetical protein